MILTCRSIIREKISVDLHVYRMAYFSVQEQPEANIFSYPNSAPLSLGYTDGAILTDETGGKVLNPLSSLVSFLTLSYSQDWRVCSGSSVVSGSSEASEQYFSQAMFVQVPIELRTGA